MNRKTVSTHKNAVAVFEIVSRELSDKSLVYMVIANPLGRMRDALEIHCVSLSAALELFKALKNVVEIEFLKRPTQQLPESFEVNPGRGWNGFSESSGELKPT